MKPLTPTTALSERWPGYNEQSWQERFAYLNELYREALSKMLAAPHPTKPQPADITAKVERSEIEMAFRQIRRAAIRGFVQPYIANASYIGRRGLVMVPLADVVAAIEDALSSQRAEGIEEAASYIEAQAKAAQDTHDLIAVQSELPICEPTFSCTDLIGIAAAIRALTQDAG